MTWYFTLKYLHVSAVLLSLALFVLRGVWMLTDTLAQRGRWVRIVPHVVDTVLLASALTLAFSLGWYPFVNSPWLTAKVLALLVYIGLGTVALKRGKTKTVRAVAWGAALLVFAYIVAVALQHQPLPF